MELAYKVVADVTKYPEFLPGCDAVAVEQKTDDELDARVTVRASGLVHSFVTTNRCEATTITMALKEGPTPVAGRAQTWYLDLEKPEDQRELLVYAEEVRPRDLWTSHPLSGA